MQEINLDMLISINNSANHDDNAFFMDLVDTDEVTIKEFLTRTASTQLFLDGDEDELRSSNPNVA